MIKAVSRVLACILLIICVVAACGDRNPGNTADPAAAANGALRIYFIDVGKGDAALIGTPDGKWIMIDTGPKKEYATIVRLFKRNNIDRLEAVFISHPHNDHMGGLNELLQHVACGKIYTTPVEFEKDTQELVQVAGNAGIELKKLTSGEKLDISGIGISALGPNGVFAEENDNSLVLMVEWDGIKALFTGDQLFAAEDALLQKGFIAECAILKTGHHGEDDATSPQFLKAVNPQYCILTNDFEGEESAKAMAVQRLSAAGAKAYVTGDTGTLLFELQNGKVAATAVKPPDSPVKNLAIDALNVKAEFIRIKNNMQESVSLNGWSIYSDKGNDTFFFPEDTVLAAGQAVAVYSGKDAKQPVDGLFWTDKNIWHDTKEDTAILLDPYGREAGRK